MYVFMLDKDKVSPQVIYTCHRKKAPEVERLTERYNPKVLHQPTSTKLNVQCNTAASSPSLLHCLSVVSTKSRCERSPLPHCLSVLSTQTGCETVLTPTPLAVCSVYTNWVWDSTHAYPTACLFCPQRLGVRHHPYPTACLFCPQRLGVRSTHPYPTACLFCLYRPSVRQHPYPTTCLFCPQTGCVDSNPTPLPVCSVYTDWVWDSTHPYPATCLCPHRLGVRQHSPLPHCLSVLSTDWVWDTPPFPPICLSLVYKDWICSPPPPQLHRLSVQPIQTGCETAHYTPTACLFSLQTVRPPPPRHCLCLLSLHKRDARQSTTPLLSVHKLWDSTTTPSPTLSLPAYSVHTGCMWDSNLPPPLHRLHVRQHPPPPPNCLSV